jgi:3-oxoacyl-[acyl-carrier-protein] synthase-3
MHRIVRGLHIAAIATVLPDQQLSVTTLGENFGSIDMERIIASSGVRNIRLVDDKTCASDLCIQAAEHLLDTANIDRKTINAIVFVSQTPDYKLPATSAIMQHRLGLSADVLAFDINYGCSGYIYGLFQASVLISSGVCDRVLLCAGDNITKMVNPKDRSAKILFGDAGTATLVERGAEDWPFHFYTDGSGAEHLCIPAGGSRIPFHQDTCIEQTDEEGNVRTLNDLYMNGMEIMNFALKYVPQSVNGVLVEAGMSKEEIDIFVFHQANQMMLNFLRKKMKLSETAVPIALQDTGNTGPASIPLALSLKTKELLINSSMKKVLCCGFGVGLSTASTIVNLSETLILEPCEYERKI